MPGEKRKLEEDTLISPQYKKQKGDEQQNRNPHNNVYYLTLAKLRRGARCFYEKLTSEVTIGLMEVTGNAMSSPSLDIMPAQQRFSCETCSRFSRNALQIPSVVCTYCEKQICHHNLCTRCKFGFCSSCCFQNYDDDDPLSDQFICIGCLA